jgi:hypothetical protein
LPSAGKVVSKRLAGNDQVASAALPTSALPKAVMTTVAMATVPAVAPSNSKEFGVDMRIPYGQDTESRLVKILERSEWPRFSMMDIEDEHNHMRAAFGLRYGIGQSGTPAAE